MIGNSGKLPVADDLFYALICYHGRIDELEMTPDLWLIPSKLLARQGEHAIASNKKTVFLRNKHIRESYEKFKNTLDALS